MLQRFTKKLTTIITERPHPFPDSDDESRYRSYAIFCLTGMPIMLAFGTYNIAVANYTLALVILICYTGLLAGLYLLYHQIAPKVVYRCNSLLFCLLLLYMAAIGGSDGSKLLWSFIFPLIAFFLLGTREGTVWNIILLLVFQLILWNPEKIGWFHPYPAEFSIRFTLTYICAATITYFYEYYRFTYRNRSEQQNRLLNEEITERSRTQELLRQSEEKYKAIYLQAAEGIIVVDSHGIIQETNPQIEKMLGYSPAELEGMNIHNFIHSEDMARTPSQLARMVAGETIRLERRLRTANGDFRHFDQSGRQIYHDRIMLLYRDITKRKAAEMALERANRELEKLATLDGLTKIANRRKFEESLEREWMRMCRQQQSLAIILCDIDFFKQYNDTYGHQEGDSCLITIAQTLRGSLHRPADLAARYGGEEFILLLPDTSNEGARQVAEHARKEISNLRLPHLGSQCSPYVTMSFGVSSANPVYGDGLPQDLIAIADKALYQAKKNGRNRVETARHGIPT